MSGLVSNKHINTSGDDCGAEAEHCEAGKAWGPRTAKREDDFKKKQLELEVTLSG